MTLPEIVSKITSLTGADTNNYTSAERLIDLNLWYQNVAGMILDSQDDSDWDDQRRSDYPVETTVLTTARDYPIPVTNNILKIKDVSITYDGTNYYKASPFDISTMNFGNAPSSATAQQSKIDQNFDKTNPGYDIKYNSIWIYPKPTSTDVANGATMIVEWFRYPTPFTLANLTDDTVIPGFDITFHPILAYGASFEYCNAKGLSQTNRILERLNDYEARLRRQYGSKDLDLRMSVQPAIINYK